MKRRHRLSFKLTLTAGILLLVLWAVWGTLHVLDLAREHQADMLQECRSFAAELAASEFLNEWNPDPATPGEAYLQQYQLFSETAFGWQDGMAGVAVATVTDCRPTLGRNFQVSVVTRSHAGLYLWWNEVFGDYTHATDEEMEKWPMFVVLDHLDADGFRRLEQQLRNDDFQPQITLEGRQDGFYFYPRQMTIGTETYVVNPEESADDLRTVTPETSDNGSVYPDCYLLPGDRLSREERQLYLDSLQYIDDNPVNFDDGLWQDAVEERLESASDLDLLRNDITCTFTVTPTSFEGYGQIFIQVLVQSRPLQHALTEARSTLIWTFLLALLCGAVFWWIFRAKVTEPLEAVTAESKKLARLAFDEFAPDTGRKDEIGSLSRALTEVSDQLHKRWDDERDLERKRQEFVASASHDLKTPLALIGGYAEAVAQNISPEDNARYLDAIEREAGRMNELVLEMLDYTKLQRMEELSGADTLSLAQLVRELLEEMAPLFAGRTVTANLEKHVRIRGDEALLRRAIGNLLSNAAKFTPEGGEITVILSTVPNPNPSYLAPPLPVLTVENEGEPIAPEDLPRIFEMFYRGDKARDRSGSGLGLAITQRIFALHHLTCRAENTDRGVRFTVEPQEA